MKYLEPFNTTGVYEKGRNYIYMHIFILFNATVTFLKYVVGVLINW